MKRLSMLVATLLAGSLLFISLAAAGSQGQGADNSRIVAALGTAMVQGETIIVEVIVAVPPGANASDTARQALQRQGARPFDSAALGSEGFTVAGLVWEVLPVVQNYNPSGEPGTVDALTALTNSHGTWDGVGTSSADLNYGGLTARCPSLVRECAGPQVYDDFNDVGWARLDRRTLGVTWFSTTRDEADMALNTRFNWNDDGSDVDVETVLLHESGHVLGLGHSDTLGAVMEPVYAGTRRGLHSDDVEGITYLYDTSATGSVSGTVSDGTDPIAGALVVLGGTSLQTTTAPDGTYTITGVPDPVTYTVNASANGFESGFIDRLHVDGADGAEVADFTLTPATTDDGGSGGPPPCKGKNKNNPDC